MKMGNYGIGWKAFLALFLLFSVAGSGVALAQTEEEKREQRIKELEEKIQILAEEVQSLKSAAATEAPAYETKFGSAAGASKTYFSDPGEVSFGGYGELLIGQVKDGSDTDVVDTQRVILYNGYKFNENIVFNSELEFEHATTGSNPDGKAGSVSVEFALIDFLLRDEFNIRGGLLLSPVGVTNELHEPTTFYGVLRPSVERQIIPSTWREAGLGVFGTFDLAGAGTVLYKVYGMSSFDSRGFKSSGNRSLRVKGNRARFDDLALASRVQYEPMPGIKIGGSLFYGNTGQGIEVDGSQIGGRFAIYEADAQFVYAGLDLRALAAWTTLGDVEMINKNLEIEPGSDKSIASRQSGWYLVGAYNVFSFLNSGSRYLEYLAPFVRFETYDTQKEVPAGYARNRANKRTEFTFGLNYKPVRNVVVKVEYQNLDNDASEAKKQFNFGLGYVF